MQNDVFLGGTAPATKHRMMICVSGARGSWLRHDL